MNRLILLVTLSPIYFLGLGYSFLNAIPKLAIGLCLAITLFATLRSPRFTEVSKRILKIFASLLILVSAGSLGTIQSTNIPITSFSISLEYAVFLSIFLLAISNTKLHHNQMVKMFQAAIYLSLIFFSLDTLANLIQGQAFMNDLGTYRFAPSLGPSAGAIYLLVIFISLIGLPRLIPRSLHLAITTLVGILIFLTATRIALASLIISLIYLSNYDINIVRTSKFRDIRKWILLSSIMTIGAFFILSRLFFEGSGAGLTSINTNGRLLIWEDLLTRSAESLWIGYGWGSTSTYLTSTGLGKGFGIQPHSDYIRLLFESGLIGLTSFITSILLIWLAINKSKLGKTNPDHAKVAKAYLLVLLILMITDNVFIYHFYTYPSLLFVSMIIAGKPSRA